MFWLVKEDASKACPKSPEYANQTKTQAEERARWHEVTECFSTEEARECITLHGLEGVVLRCVKDFGIIAALFFNRVGDIEQKALRENDLALGAWE